MTACGLASARSRGLLGSRHAAVSSVFLGAGLDAIALLAEHIPRRDRIALPAGRRRYLVAAHHQRGRADGGAGAEPGRGQRHAVRAQRRTLFEHNGVHPHDAVVEQVGLHHAAAVDGRALCQRDQVGLGQPVGFAPHAAADLGAQAPAATGSSPGCRWRRGRTTARRRSRRRCPTPRCATRTTTTADVRWPGCGPTTSHFATTAMPPATAPAISSTTPPASAAHRQPNRIGQRTAARRSTATPIANVTITGINRQVSTGPRMTFSRSDGWKVRSASAAVGLRRNRIGGLPSHDDPALALCGVAPTAPPPARRRAPGGPAG